MKKKEEGKEGKEEIEGTLTTVIMLVVRVPVLSEQTTLTQPNVSALRQTRKKKKRG